MRQAPSLLNEVAYYETVWLFGHYDSRGGAFIDFESSSVVKAIVKFAKKFYNATGSSQEEIDLALNSAHEDFLGRYELVVCSSDGTMPPLARSTDLLYEYEGSYVPLRLLSRFVSPKGAVANRWEENKVLVLWHDTDEEMGKMLDNADERPEEEYDGVLKWEEPDGGGVRQYKLVVWEGLGEDAHGLLLL